MNPCPNWRDRLLDYTVGALRASRVNEVERHLNDCPACSHALAELRCRAEQLDGALRQLVEAAEPSPAFRARVLAAVEAEPVSAAGQPAWVGVLAAVAVVVLASVSLPRLGERSAAVSPTAVAALTEWRSPTEGLLRSPAEELLRTTPRLGELYFPLESAPPRTEKEKGENNES